MDEVVPLRLQPPYGFELLDQTRLPGEVRRVNVTTVEAACEAIAALRVRGAPLLGVTAAATMALAAQLSGASDAELEAAAATISAVRPTAVELGASAAQAVASPPSPLVPFSAAPARSVDP